jgi:ABC-type multidrug transport system fused ATPase/permease subunit
LVLKNIKARIKSKEKVGIVGRTGSGKTRFVHDHDHDDDDDDD